VFFLIVITSLFCVKTQEHPKFMQEMCHPYRPRKRENRQENMSNIKDNHVPYCLKNKTI